MLGGFRPPPMGVPPPFDGRRTKGVRGLELGLACLSLFKLVCACLCLIVLVLISCAFQCLLRVFLCILVLVCALVNI